MTGSKGSKLVGVAEIADILGVSYTRAHQLTREKGFPDPAYSNSRFAVWERQDVVRWAEASDRRI